MKRAVLAAIATAAFSLAAHASAQSAAPTRAELLRAKLESRNRSYVFVTMHRVSNGKGPSTEYTLEEIKKFRLKGTDGKTITD